jgi:hypothetical protein
MGGYEGKVLGLGPFELSIGSRLLTNNAKVGPAWGAYRPDDRQFDILTACCGK